MENPQHGRSLREVCNRTLGRGCNADRVGPEWKPVDSFSTISPRWQIGGLIANAKLLIVEVGLVGLEPTTKGL